MLLYLYNILLLAGSNHVSFVWPLPNAHFSYKCAFCRDKTMTRQTRPFCCCSWFWLEKGWFRVGVSSKSQKNVKRYARFWKMCCENVYILHRMSIRVSFKILYLRFLMSWASWVSFVSCLVAFYRTSSVILFCLLMDICFLWCFSFGVYWML